MDDCDRALAAIKDIHDPTLLAKRLSRVNHQRHSEGRKLPEKALRILKKLQGREGFSQMTPLQLEALAFVVMFWPERVKGLEAEDVSNGKFYVNAPGFEVVIDAEARVWEADHFNDVTGRA